MADLSAAIAAARQELDDHYTMGGDLDPQPFRDLLAALDAAQPVAWADDDEIKMSRQFGGSFNAWLSKYPGNDTPLYLAPHAPPAAVPAGYVLVPVEPTPEIIAAGWFGGEMHIALGHANAYRECEGDYARMLAANKENGNG